jgi:hypothetical protein
MMIVVIFYCRAKASSTTESHKTHHLCVTRLSVRCDASSQQRHVLRKIGLHAVTIPGIRGGHDDHDVRPCPGDVVTAVPELLHVSVLLIADQRCWYFC